MRVNGFFFSMESGRDSKCIFYKPLNSLAELCENLFSLLSTIIKMELKCREAEKMG